MWNEFVKVGADLEAYERIVGQTVLSLDVRP